jgi:glucose-1-phosphate thymidylyltransferase
MKVIIPVAGFGKRMRPHTHVVPKPLVSVAGRPAIDFILEELKKLDVSEIIFITGHLKDKFEDYMRKNYHFKMRFIEQKIVNGTAGAIGLAEKLIDEPVLIIFVDTVFEADLSILKKHDKPFDGVIWAKEVEDYQRFGVCVLDKDGYLAKIVEKPTEPISRLANIGMYYTKDYRLLFEGIHYLFDNNITGKGEYWLTDAFEYMIKKGTKFICPPVAGWYDVGKPETLIESNRELLKKQHQKNHKFENSKIIPPVNIADGVTIKNSTVGPYVAVAKGVTIDGSTVRDSVIAEGARIADSHMEMSILGERVEVTNLEGSFNVGDDSVVVGKKVKNK